MVSILPLSATVPLASKAKSSPDTQLAGSTQVGRVEDVGD
jgi:hypothetical protein